VQLIWQAAGQEGEITYVPRAVLQKQEHFKAYAPPLMRPIPVIYDLSKSEQDFGFRTTPITQWILETVEWYRKNYKGAPSKGYEYRAEEVALAAKWRTAFDQVISTF
jgi:hypothetical protein